MFKPPLCILHILTSRQQLPSSVSTRDRQTSSGTVKENQLGLDVTPEPPTEAPGWTPRPGGTGDWLRSPRALAGGEAPGGSAGVGVLLCCSLIGPGGWGTCRTGRKGSADPGHSGDDRAGLGSEGPGTRVRGVDGPRRSPRGPRTQPRAGPAGRPHSQHDPRDVQPHWDAPVFEGGGDEAAEGERRHHAQREGEQGVRARQDGVHRGDLSLPGPGSHTRTSGSASRGRPVPAHPRIGCARPAPPPFRSSDGSAHAPTPSGSHPLGGRARAGRRCFQWIRQSSKSTGVGLCHGGVGGDPPPPLLSCSMASVAW